MSGAEAFGGIVVSSSSSSCSNRMEYKSHGRSLTSSSQGAKRIQLKMQTRRARGIAAVAPLKMSSSSSSDYSNNNNNNDNDNNNNNPSYWKLPNDFYMFLTQRSIQSFMFLTYQLRDPETCYWVEDFSQPNLVQQSSRNGQKKDFSLSDSIPLGDIATSLNDGTGSAGSADKDRVQTDMDKRTCHLLRYHGLAAMDTTLFPTWESYFETLLEEPTDTWVIASDIPHIPDYTWEIDPTSLCSRILSVREQLSKEFAKDLQAVSDMGGQTFDWYWEKLRQSRDNETNDNDNETNDNENRYNTQTPLITDPSSLRGSRDNLLFLEINVDDPRLDHKPSPLRRGNFDLLVLLATEEAIHRVLNRWESKRVEGNVVGSDYEQHERASHCFLEEFYQERQHFFHGPLPNYGKADDLLEELLLLDSDNASLVNPTKIAELVLREREIVALDWMEIAREAPMHHMRIQKLRLDKMMTAATKNADVSETEGGFAETAQNGGFDPGPGAFE